MLFFQLSVFSTRLLEGNKERRGKKYFAFRSDSIFTLMMRLWWALLMAGFLLSAPAINAQEAVEEPEGEAEGSAEGEAEGEAEAEAEGEAEGEAEEEVVEEEVQEETVEEVGEVPEDGGSGEAPDEEKEEEEECEIEETEGSGGGVEDILALGDKKCKKKDDAEALTGADALAAELFKCDMNEMDEKVAECMTSMDSRVKTLEDAIISGGGGLEDQITLVLVKKGVIDCENDTQCADDRACLNSYEEPGRMLCEKPCERTRCHVPYSECIATDHKASCECKDEFHGNGSVACIPTGFDEKGNNRGYKIFDDDYVTFENASEKCSGLGARLPVLDTDETITIVKEYLENANFSVFEEWDQSSSRRVWLGLILRRGSGLVWADGQRVQSYPASSRLFVWEARRMLSQEVSYADNSRHYALYVDGDLAKLPGGGRKGAAVLCELVPGQLQQPPQDPYNDPRYGQRPPQQQQQQQGPGYPNDGGYPNYPPRRRGDN